jgi:drug/metabolite transporter (DMT)-like permease
MNLSLMLAPYLFVLLWSTGFLGARLGLPFAGPFTLLSLRFLCTVLILAVVIPLTGARWPGTLAEVRHIAIVGILAHGLYLGANWTGIAEQMPLGIVALIGGLQPLLTAVLAAPLLNEKVTLRVWAGLSLGLLGVVLVLLPKIGMEGITPLGVIGVIIGLFSLTAGTLYQKRYCPAAPLITGAAIQFTAALILVVPTMLLVHEKPVVWTWQLGVSVLWLSVVLSLGAITLLWILVRRGEASKVASMFYLVPPVTALLAYLMFGEKLELLTLLGMAVAAGGVALVTLPQRKS